MTAEAEGAGPAWSSAARGTEQTAATVEGGAGDWEHGSEAGAGAVGGDGGGGVKEGLSW